MRAFDVTPATVLAVYAHPDDADVAAGGALASWAARGASVHLLIVANGAKGSLDPATDVAALQATRSHELQVAANILGATGVIELGYEDGEFGNDENLRETLVFHIRRLRPDVVLGPDPTATFFGGAYVNHRDHRETGWALLDAVAPASGMPHYFPNAGAPHVVEHLLLSGTHEPDVVVDVTGALDVKVKAVLAHDSQVGDDPSSVRAAMQARAQQAGRTIGVAHGEAFRHVVFAH